MNLFSNLKITFAIVALISLSCSKNDNSANNTPSTPSISNQPLSGTVFNDNFTAIDGKAFKSDENVSINITNVIAGCSSDVTKYELYLWTQVLSSVGEYSANVAFGKKGETPLNYFDAKVEVTKLSETEITVKILANQSAMHSVEGTITIPYCTSK